MSKSPLTPEQKLIVKALAAGATLTAAAAAHGLHRVTLYRWMHTHREFQDALRRARADFILARRDQLHDLSTAALFTLHNILENPQSSPAVLLRTAMFILTRPVAPKTGWTMPEPAPPPDSEEILDSSLIESGFAQLPCLCGIERETEDEAPEAAAEAAAEAATDATSATPSEPAAEAPADFPALPIEPMESTASEPSTRLEAPLGRPPEAAKMQHVSPISEDVVRRLENWPVSRPGSLPGIGNPPNERFWER